MLRIFFVLTGSCLLLAPIAAGAATLNVVGGELVGAIGVDVGGTFYDVDFIDDSCINLFSGCDEAADFALSDSATAELAAQALLDQVLVDGPLGNFDTNYLLTAGCSSVFAGRCDLFIPFDVSPLQVDTIIARNFNEEFADTFLAGGPVQPSTIPGATAVFARFTESSVPEPGTAILLGTGIALLALEARRKESAPPDW